MRKHELQKLKRFLEGIFKKYNKKELLFSDPIKFPHRYHRREDIEISAFIASVFAFGRVKLFFDRLEKIFSFLGDTPYERIKNIEEKEIQYFFKDFNYRFYKDKEINTFFLLLKMLIREKGTIENLFNADKNVPFIERLHSFAKFFEPANSASGFPFVSDPKKGSPAKRLLLFLRWMVRKDEVDFGIWKRTSKSELIVPLDTHIFRISKELGLTTYKNPSFASALEITENLRQISPYDPVKYDFALTRIGILRDFHNSR